MAFGKYNDVLTCIILNFENESFKFVDLLYYL